MNRLLSYLLLPKEISEFERRYLARINRIAFLFFLGHVPVFVGIAALAGTSMLQALVLTPLALVGPALAYRLLHNPRHLSIVYGFTAMCMGGLLVHFGQGAMQIEMHFYFFVLIALLAVFANPMAIITAAVTVALHHLLLYLFLPRSVFNYEASLWAVGVHAAFVVLESVAACFVARSFFDNVIGLEKIVKKRTDELSNRNQDMRMVLDNVGQGFATINLDGTMSPERSAAAAKWLGAYVPGKKLWEHIAELDPSGADWFRVAWEAVAEDVLPLELTIDQLPKRCTSGPSIYAFEYRPVLAGGKLVKVLLVMSDVTQAVERERFEVEQRDFLRVFERVMKDKRGFLEFFGEADGLVTKVLRGDLPLGDLRRHIHTLKGNAALFGLSGIANLCHALEGSLLEGDVRVAAQEQEELGRVWGRFAANLRGLVGSDRARCIEIDHSEYVAVLQALDGGAGREDLALRMKAWQFESAEARLERLAEQAQAIASRLGKPAPEVSLEPNGVRLYAASFAEFWAAFTHALRNAIDHGIESPEDRLAAGKPAAGRLRLSTRVENGALIVEIADDGRGVAWDLVREKARLAGLPHATRQDVLEALFLDGFTTKGEVSEFSGRGIGMGAVRAACKKMGGEVQVTSEPGAGLCLRFCWPNVYQRVEALVLPSVPQTLVSQRSNPTQELQ
jgi:two-component system, chemotaxis family, sensor kinase CheA